MNNSVPLVWIHLGPSKVAKHLKKSLESHSERFRDRPLILLVDYENNAHDLGIKNLKVNKVTIDSLEWDLIKQNIMHDLTFRNGFWFNSLARFKVLSEFMKNEGIEEALHVESDVVLMSNFPLNKFSHLGEILSYGLQGEGQAIAAILYVGSQKVLENLIKYCFEEVQRNPMSTDMTILHRFWAERPNDVVILPSLTNDLLLKQQYKQLPKVLSENLEFFGGLFDPISIGQFLFGIDPRNTKGRKILYREDKSHYLRVSEMVLEIENGRLFLGEGNEAYPIFSLHVHSKDIQAFDYLSLNRLLEKRISQMDKGETSELSIREWLKVCLLALRRRANRGGLS